MKRTLIALAVALTLLLTGGFIGQTAALLGGSFTAQGAATTRDFGVALVSAPSADTALQQGVTSQMLTWRIRNAAMLPADIGTRFHAPAESQGFAVGLDEVYVTLTVTAEIYASPVVARYSGPLRGVTDMMLVASRSLPAGEVWRIDARFVLPSNQNPAVSDGISLPWGLDFTARQTAQGTSDLRSNTTSAVPSLGWLH